MGRVPKGILEEALAHHRAGRWDQAEAGYRRLLRLEPHNGDARHLLGVLAFQRGDGRRALELIDSAIQRQPSPLFYQTRGSVLQALGRLQEALRAFERSLELHPANAQAWVYAGNIHVKEGRWESALACFERAVALAPDWAEAHNNLGLAHSRLGHGEAAQQALERAVALRPDLVEAWANLGNLLRQRGSPLQAVACLERAVALNPASTVAQVNLGAALEALGRFERAEACYRQALRLDPDCPEAWNNLGGILRLRGDFGAALSCFDRAAAARPAVAEVHNNRGAALEKLGRYEEALAAYNDALRLNPQFVEAHRNRALLLLLRGEWEQGWQEYEWRWKAPDVRIPNIPAPRWEGEPLQGKRILLWAEQGLGDTIQFIRYARLVKALGAHVVVACPPRLVELVKTAPGIDEVLPDCYSLPACDVQAPLMSLPRILRTLPAEVPYLRVEPRRQPCAEIRSIGVVWSGNPENPNNLCRSLPVESVLDLVRRHKQFRWYSLQPGFSTHELPSLEPPDCGLEETAALVAGLDLVITVDTMMAHLAGALGRPVWVLLPFSPDFRWLLRRTDSPWYPTARLFRQPAPGAWAPVMAAVHEALQ